MLLALSLARNQRLPAVMTLMRRQPKYPLNRRTDVEMAEIFARRTLSAETIGIQPHVFGVKHDWAMAFPPTARAATVIGGHDKASFFAIIAHAVERNAQLFEPSVILAQGSKILGVIAKMAPFVRVVER